MFFSDPATASAGTLPGEFLPHLLCTGTGANDRPAEVNPYFPADSSKNYPATTPDPFLHPDGTCGAKTILTSTAARPGAVLTYGIGNYRQSGPLEILRPGTKLRGLNAGGPVDPNAEYEGFSGSKIALESGTWAKVGIGGNADRIFNVQIENLYVHQRDFQRGTPKSENSMGIEVKGRMDQMKLMLTTFVDFKYAYKVTNSAGGANLDTAYFLNDNIIGCDYGLYDADGLLNCFFESVGGCYCDLDASGIYVGRGVYRSTANSPGSDGRSPIIGNKIFIRTCRLGGNGIHWAGNRLKISNCAIEDTGLNLIAGGYTNNPTNAIFLDGNYNIVNGCTISGTATGTGIYINSGFENRIMGNSFGGATGNDGYNGNYFAWSGDRTYSNNRDDVYVGVNATDTRITHSGSFRLTNNGLRTTVNDFATNVGDPEQTGDWYQGTFMNTNGAQVTGRIPKWAGLKLHDTQSNKVYLYTGPGATDRVLLN